MSLLLGVRGSSPKNEGREGIIQQPGSFYNGNPSSSIWGNPPTQPLWCDLSLANGVSSSSSSTAVPSMSSTSLAFKSSSSMAPEAEEKQWQHSFPTKGEMAAEEGNQEHTTPIKVEGYGYNRDNAQPPFIKLDSAYRPSDLPNSPFSFGFSSEPIVFGRDNAGSNSFRFMARSSPQETLNNGKPAGGLSEEGQRRANAEANGNWKNEKSWKFGAADNYSSQNVAFGMPPSGEDLRKNLESRLPFQGSSLNSSSVLHAPSLERISQAVEIDTSSASDDKSVFSTQASDSLARSSFTEPKRTFIEKKTLDVFVFGALKSSGSSSLKSSAPQQKSFQSSFGSSSSRTRTSKFKRQSNVVKGKGLAPLGGIGVQQSAPAFSRDASPQSNAGLDSATESSHFDEAECSDAGIWPEDNIETVFNFEASEILQPLHMSEEKASLGLQDEGQAWPLEGLLSKTKEDSYSPYNFEQQDYLSRHEETQPVRNKQNLGTRFSSWWPFQSKNDGGSGHDWEDGGSSNTLKVEDNAASSVDDMGGPSAALGRSDSSKVKSTVVYGNCAEHGNSSNLFFSGSFVKDPIDSVTSSSENVTESGWNFGGKEPIKPFNYGVSQQFQEQVDSNIESAYGGSGTTSASTNTGNLKTEKLHETRKDLSSGFDENSASGLPSSSISFSAGMNFSPAFHKGPFSTDRQPFSHSAILTDNEPLTNLFKNLNFLDAMHSSSFVERDNDGPTGEFSGPVSSSESSASENSPTRKEHLPARNKPFNQSQCFEFQGSTKERKIGLATGKKKPRPLNTRKQGRGANRPRRFTPARSFKDMTTPMDFSPGMNDAELNSRAANSEQPYMNCTRTMDIDGREISSQLSEIQSMKEFTAAAAGLSIGSDQESLNFQKGKQVLEDSNEWANHTLLSKRSGKWKRLGSEEGQSSSTYQENLGVAQHPERAGEFLTDDYTPLNVEERNHEPTFTFGASSLPANSSSMHRRFARRSQKEKAGDKFEGFASADSTTASEPDGSLTTNEDGVSKAKVGGSFFLSHAPLEKKGTSSFPHNRNAEEFAVLSTDSSVSGHPFVAAIPKSSSAVKSAAAEQVCERWRLRGNQAYANGDFPKAEEYYSRGASSVSPDETSQSCIRASMLCYSNRAATRMAVGRMREALADCKRAMVVDPSFLRVRLRAASCHLALGESKVATDMFKECSKYAKEGIKPDSKILAEATEGTKKCQQLDDYTDRALQLLQKQTLKDSTNALRLVNEALSISSFSEPLHELKAQILLSLRRYEECLQLCEQSLPAAERNHGVTVNEQQHQDSSLRGPCQSNENIHLKLWRWRLSAKAFYHLGKLDEALDLLVKHEEAVSVAPNDKATNLDSLAPFMASIRDLLRHKAAGNEAFQLGKHAEAVEHYTAALACNGDSRPYNAVCFCNRAAASQALGHIADAIADCSRAIALDSVYPKALSRRATLHEMIRDYGQACNDLRRLITLLEDYQLHGKNNQAMKGGGSNINAQDLRQAQDRLEKGEEEMKKSHPIDHYLVLGVDSSCSANEIKKAYRKAALKHHPDKAGQFLARGENGDDGGLWKEVGDEVRRDCERLFKLIGEANAILSDPTKRLRYDTEEENRKLRGKDSNSQISSSTSEGYRAQYEKSGRRQRERWDAWYAPQHQRWQSGPDAAQPDTYGRRSTYGADPAKTGKASWNTDFSWDKI
eukprot:c23915_g1_i1 orf=359-5419(+)